MIHMSGYSDSNKFFHYSITGLRGIFSVNQSDWVQLIVFYYNLEGARRIKPPPGFAGRLVVLKTMGRPAPLPPIKIIIYWKNTGRTKKDIKTRKWKL